MSDAAPADVPAHQLRPLPAGWISVLDEASGEFYYVDETKTPPEITWDDPRLKDVAGDAPLPPPRSRQRPPRWSRRPRKRSCLPRRTSPSCRRTASPRDGWRCSIRPREGSSLSTRTRTRRW
ncbi:hypothetical protein DFJ74DRAFT_111742 [Hyaloraphidium curvatum]|nr:hypothetical protein DFJ74DRAFT_111742 [Hyaloraphidium curvatum]